LPATIAPLLADRISFVGTIQSYLDANSRATATLYSAALQYKLSCDTKKEAVCPYGSPSLTLQYDNGIDREMLQQKKLLMAKINYAF